MNLQKRECPISFRFVPYGAGWEDVYLTVEGTTELFVVTGTHVPGSVDELFSAVAGLHPRYCNSGHLFSVYVDIDDNGNPVETKFWWDGEGVESEWTFSRPPTADVDVPIEVKITKKDDGADSGESACFTVGYKDLCYAVAKGMTEAMKKHGLFAYGNAVWNHDLNLRLLLMLKAFALDTEDVLKVEDLGRGNGERTDFAKELELILFDM